MTLIEITAELIAACLGLLSVLLGILFAKAEDAKKLSNDQGDRMLEIAHRAYDLVYALLKDKKEYADRLADAKILLVLVDEAWNDSKVRTPEFDELFEALMKVLKELY